MILLWRRLERHTEVGDLRVRRTLLGADDALHSMGKKVRDVKNDL